MFKRFMTWLKKIFNIKNEPILDFKIEVPSISHLLEELTIPNTPPTMQPNFDSLPGINFTPEQLNLLAGENNSPLAQAISAIPDLNIHINLVGEDVPHQPGTNGWSFFVPHHEPEAQLYVPINQRPMVAGS